MDATSLGDSIMNDMMGCTVDGEDWYVQFAIFVFPCLLQN